MRVLVVGSGGVGAAVAAVAQRRDFFERMVFADVDEDRARRAVAQHGGDRFGAAAVDASDASSVAELARAERADAIPNAVDPRFDPPIFQSWRQANGRVPAPSAPRRFRRNRSSTSSRNTAPRTG
jgi:saccharopine dehydrogenase (NAD+, L-lysine forming)